MSDYPNAIVERAHKAAMKYADQVQRTQAGLLAALDPDDEAVVAVVARDTLAFAYPGQTLEATTPSNRDYFTERARAAIAALRAHIGKGESHDR